MEIQGTIMQVLPIQQGTSKSNGKSWSKQDYILQTDDKYPKTICFSLWGDLIDRVSLQVGETITAQVDVESREWNGRWYTEIRAYRVERGEITIGTQLPQQTYGTQAAQQKLPQGHATIPHTQQSVQASNDLPF